MSSQATNIHLVIDNFCDPSEQGLPCPPACRCDARAVQIMGRYVTCTQTIYAVVELLPRLQLQDLLYDLVMLPQLLTLMDRCVEGSRYNVSECLAFFSMDAEGRVDELRTGGIWEVLVDKLVVSPDLGLHALFIVVGEYWSRNLS